MENRFYAWLARRQPGLKRLLRIAKLRVTPEEYVKKSFHQAFIFSLAFSFTLLALTRNIGFTLIVFLFSLILLYKLFNNRVIVEIKKRRQRIDRDLLFAGQYMLVKLQSGLPLLNTLIHAAKAYTETGFFFREIVQDINTGVPIEEALSTARDYCPSDNMKKILTEIVTSLKTGADVVGTLKNTLDEIAKDLMLEVKAYNKRLNSLMMFYMILGTVLPSIGISLLLIFLSFAGVTLPDGFLLSIAFFLLLMQFLFIALVRNSRPTINI